MKVVHLLLIICVFSLVYIVVVQGNTITSQHQTIQQLLRGCP
jgi:hypothetical protein